MTGKREHNDDIIKNMANQSRRQTQLDKFQCED